MSSLRDILGLDETEEFQHIDQEWDLNRLKQQNFHPVIVLPENYEVFDFSEGYDPDRNLKYPYGVGKYNEHRPTMYKGEQFHYETSLHQRAVHIGIDIAAPVKTDIYAFEKGVVYAVGNNDLPYDYGPTLITKHRIQDLEIYALFGHVTTSVLTKWSAGDSFEKGEILTQVGSKMENGGWNPHLHFQLSRVAPKDYDLPGVVSLMDRELAIKVFPDPRYILGEIY